MNLKPASLMLERVVVSLNTITIRVATASEPGMTSNNEDPAATDKDGHAFEAAPAAESAVPNSQSTEAAFDYGIPEAIQNRIPEFLRPLIYQSVAEDLVADKDALGPDAFMSRFAWNARGLCLPGQPLNDLNVVDIAGDGTKVKIGETAIGTADPTLQITLPQGPGACRVIVGVPELGGMDKDFVIKSINLAKEKVAGGDPEEEFQQEHFKSRIRPGYDLARLRGLWTMKEVAWSPFILHIPSMRTPNDNGVAASSPCETALRGGGRDVLYLQVSWITVQTIPLENNRFLFVCALPSRKFASKNPLRSAHSLAELKKLAGENTLTKEQIFELLSRDLEKTCRECFESIMLSDESATKLADGRPELLCQLLLLDIFRAVSESWTRLLRDIAATILALDLPSIHTGDPEQILVEMKGNYEIFNNLLMAAVDLQNSNEYLLNWLFFDQGGPDCAVTDANRWLKRVIFELRADLEHNRAELERHRDHWSRRWSEGGELIRKAESKNVARLTLVAAIFLPLSFGADLLGMQFRVRELGFILYDYLGLVVSAGLFVYLIYKIGPRLRGVIGLFNRRRRAGPKKRSAFALSRFFVQSNFPLVFIILWSVLVASFMVGMIDDIGSSLEVLRYGGIACAGLLGLFLIIALLYGWLMSLLFEFLGWNVIG
ncbi:unnamed protein product [Clonostachys rhizophaga]|uniref:Uncharacterized protein n=1 Tax=Clonostachys rhizophaga TaxID=160324 RepID=A0A9N9VMF3_9HYPO|nr:unnamed protein product [Clonostachys rhizophaga]